MRKFTTIIAVILMLGGQLCGAEQKAKNIVLVIVDGGGLQAMGLLAQYARYAPNSPYKDKTSNLEKYFNMADAGLSLTTTQATLVTDSAAAGTHIATGRATLPGSVGVDYEGKAQKSILEHARDAGKSTGLITTVYLQDATPSVFAAHQSNRGKKEEIARDMLGAGVDVMLGGGARYFKELYKDFRAKGYTIAVNKKEFERAPEKKGAKLLGIFAETELPYVIYKDKSVPTLTQMTSKALNILDKNENGFFVMIEAGKVDWTLHGNDAAASLHELLEFDAALGFIMDWASKREDTLVVLTADHETGGFIFNYRNLKGSELNKAKTSGEVLYGGKTDYVNFSVFDKLLKHKEYFYMVSQKFSDLPKEKQTPKNLGKMLSAAVGYEVDPGIYEHCSTFKCAHKNYDTSLGISWGTGAHSATPVMVAAYGVGQGAFKGLYHITEVNHKMMNVFDLGEGNVKK